ncbi:MtnX-like HAD-IB family phosphatase [bacterium]|nr:MtnX-like HAD-IB family phosphatase [bacterium]
MEGKITSQENAIKQVDLISEISPQQLDDFINTVEIDDYFLEFLKYIQSKNINFTIVSDGFDLFIEKTLEKYNINNIPYYANHIIYENNRFKIEFPYHNEKCDLGAGMCKCNKVKEKEFCYIGDGTSDLCIARKADLLFATKNLKKYCEKNLINHYPFKSFSNIIKILESKE